MRHGKKTIKMLSYLLTPTLSFETNHFFAEFHGRWEGLGVSSQDVAKVDVDEVARLREQQVIQVPVTHSQ